MHVLLLQTLYMKSFHVWFWLFIQRAIGSMQNFVHQQWEKIEDLWKKHIEILLAPIIGHSSDGDSRIKQLMLKDYSSTTCIRYKIHWEGCKLTGLYDGFKVTKLRDQDYIQNEKKKISESFV